MRKLECVYALMFGAYSYTSPSVIKVPLKGITYKDVSLILDCGGSELRSPPPGEKFSGTKSPQGKAPCGFRHLSEARWKVDLAFTNWKKFLTDKHEYAENP